MTYRSIIDKRLERTKLGGHSCSDELPDSTYCRAYEKPTMCLTTGLHSRVFDTSKDAAE